MPLLLPSRRNINISMSELFPMYAYLFKEAAIIFFIRSGVNMSTSVFVNLIYRIYLSIGTP